MILLLACATPPAAPEPAESVTTALPAPALLRRLSLDLRGVLPDSDQLDAVEADPDLLSTYRDEWLVDPMLEERLVVLLAEQWHTRVDIFDIEYFDYDLQPSEEFAFERSVGEEPLRLMARIIATDQPWSEAVQADWTMADPMLGDIWPVDYPGEGVGWQEVRYTDDRPAAGVLASNGLWWRYSTTLSNLNRRRAAALVDLLICHDYLERPIRFTDQTDLISNEEAVSTNTDCVSCHASLDPIAGALFGFWWVGQYSVEEQTAYHPEREALAESFLGVEAAWFGQPISGLQQLGEVIPQDPRYSRCLTERMARSLWRRPVEAADFETIVALDAVLQSAELRPLALIEAITDGPTYRAGDLTAAADEADISREKTARVLTPEQLDTVLLDLTGFAWSWDGFAQLHNDDIGYRILAGGVDGSSVFQPAGTPGLSAALLMQRLAEAAASSALDGGGPVLLEGLDVSAPPDAAGIEALCWRLYAARPDESRVDDLLALSDAIAGASDTQTAWKGLLTAMLRDPDFLIY